MGWGSEGGSSRNRWSFHELQAIRPDTAAVLETGPGGQREERCGGRVMFCRERDELSLMGPAHLSRGRHAGSCVTESLRPRGRWLCCSKCGHQGTSQIQIPGFPNRLAAAVATTLGTFSEQFLWALCLRSRWPSCHPMLRCSANFWRRHCDVVLRVGKLRHSAVN